MILEFTSLFIVMLFHSCPEAPDVPFEYITDRHWRSDGDPSLGLTRVTSPLLSHEHTYALIPPGCPPSLLLVFFPASPFFHHTVPHLQSSFRANPNFSLFVYRLTLPPLESLSLSHPIPTHFRSSSPRSPLPFPFPSSLHPIPPRSILATPYSHLSSFTLPWHALSPHSHTLPTLTLPPYHYHALTLLSSLHFTSSHFHHLFASPSTPSSLISPSYLIFPLLIFTHTFSLLAPRRHTHSAKHFPPHLSSLSHTHSRSPSATNVFLHTSLPPPVPTTSGLASTLVHPPCCFPILPSISPSLFPQPLFFSFSRATTSHTLSFHQSLPITGWTTIIFPRLE